MRSISLFIGVDFKDGDAAGVVLVGHGVERENAGLGLNELSHRQWRMFDRSPRLARRVQNRSPNYRNHYWRVRFRSARLSPSFSASMPTVRAKPCARSSLGGAHDRDRGAAM